MSCVSHQTAIWSQTCTYNKCNEFFFWDITLLFYLIYHAAAELLFVLANAEAKHEAGISHLAISNSDHFTIINALSWLSLFFRLIDSQFTVTQKYKLSIWDIYITIKKITYCSKYSLFNKLCSTNICSNCSAVQHAAENRVWGTGTLIFCSWVWEEVGQPVTRSQITQGLLLARASGGWLSFAK